MTDSDSMGGSEQCGICGVGLSKASIVNGEEYCNGCQNEYLAACFAE